MSESERMVLMKLYDFLDAYDGNAVVTINQDDETLYYEQSVEEIVEDEDFGSIKNLEVDSFGIELSEEGAEDPVLYIDL